MPEVSPSMLSVSFLQKCLGTCMQSQETLGAKFLGSILGRSPGSGGGTNPLEAPHSSWEANLNSRTKDGLFTALHGEMVVCPM